MYIRIIVLLLAGLFGSVYAGFSQSPYVQEMERQRQEKLKEFRQPGAPPFKSEKARKSFAGLDWYPVDAAWRVEASLEPFADQDTLEFPTSAGTVKSFIRYARLVFTVEGHTDTLEAYRSVQNLSHPEYGKLLFVPFTDHNSGESCYGGGRYLDPALPEAGSPTLWLDFNEAYNPYCAYSDGWFCPIPPAVNYVNMPVNAGEKNYPGAGEGDKGRKKGKAK